MKGRPTSSEAAPYYFNYINLIATDDILAVLEAQREETASLLRGIPEERSLDRYAPDKWSIRQMWGHVNDAERLFVFRAFWFARGLPEPLPSFDQDTAVRGGDADHIPWASHIEEFMNVRRASVDFFRNLSGEAWMRSGVASGNSVSVRALAYIVAGHTAHHAAVLREKYLVARATG